MGATRTTQSCSQGKARSSGRIEVPPGRRGRTRPPRDDYHCDQPTEGVAPAGGIYRGTARFKPILLTELADKIGAATILVDPIFQGAAISPLFGLASSTLLAVLVIPAIYILLRDDGRPISQELVGGDAT